MLESIKKFFTKKEREVIHELVSKPKIRKRYYNMWKCIECAEEFYFQPLRCPICTADVKMVRKYTTFVEYPLTKYVQGTQQI